VPDGKPAFLRDQIYNPDGKWVGWNGFDNAAMDTNPGGIFAMNPDESSRGFLDDACDGIVEVALTYRQRTFSSFARVMSGPPAFAPDSWPIRRIIDELEMHLLGPESNQPAINADVREILRRAFETVRLMNTAVMNGNLIGGGNDVASNMTRQDTNDYRRLYVPIMATKTTAKPRFHGDWILTANEDDDNCSPRLVSDLVAREATPIERFPLVGERLLRVGDVAFALDPLSSQGVQHALSSAGQAAIVIHTILARPENATWAKAFFRERHHEMIDRHRASCAALYSRQNRFETPFWQERKRLASAVLSPTPSKDKGTFGRAGLDDLLRVPLILSPEARWCDTPVIAGDFVELRPALCHPSLPRPIAFLGNQSLCELFAQFFPLMTGIALLHRWITNARMLPAVAALALESLVRKGVLVPVQFQYSNFVHGPEGPTPSPRPFAGSQ
jgi:Tryptophan halogenase